MQGVGLHGRFVIDVEMRRTAWIQEAGLPHLCHDFLGHHAAIAFTEDGVAHDSHSRRALHGSVLVTGRHAKKRSDRFVDDGLERSRLRTPCSRGLCFPFFLRLLGFLRRVRFGDPALGSLHSLGVDLDLRMVVRQSDDHLDLGHVHEDGACTILRGHVLRVLFEPRLNDRKRIQGDCCSRLVSVRGGDQLIQELIQHLCAHPFWQSYVDLPPGPSLSCFFPGPHGSLTPSNPARY